MSELKTKPTAAQTANNWGSRNHIHTLVLMAVTVVGIYFSYLLAVPFLPALAWALALVVWDDDAGRYFARAFENHGFYRHYDVTVEGNVWTISGKTERARIEFSHEWQATVDHLGVADKKRMAAAVRPRCDEVVTPNKWFQPKLNHGVRGRRGEAARRFLLCSCPARLNVVLCPKGERLWLRLK